MQKAPPYTKLFGHQFQNVNLILLLFNFVIK